MLTTVINACARSGKLVSGKFVHGAVIRRGHDSNDVVAAKHGLGNPCVIPYTSMIVAAAKHGLGKLSVELFEEMIDKRIKPNDVSFVALLHACSHSGLIEEGLGYLNSMTWKHGMVPEKHYTCIVDMLDRTGRLDEAYRLAKSIKVNPNEGASLWGTLLSASRLNGRVDIAVEASKKLIESNQQVDGAYVTLSNAYVWAGELENANDLRMKMKQTGVYKEPGCSWIGIKDSTYVFYAGNVSFESGTKVLRTSKELEREMRKPWRNIDDLWVDINVN
ncbi:Pentatricopeptide repeat-containing protein [Hibiscus syriacus]|uniref:Pentatricopeptide repeat-containing protein n=1 Tax=Hibiscus syriacus TaxID=106335 RepID=A0A6A2Z1I5_HIBSY|nr:Pentatricopeptide repeat-containing protein [Hibiscus syriacus]